MSEAIRRNQDNINKSIDSKRKQDNNLKNIYDKSVLNDLENKFKKRMITSQ